MHGALADLPGYLGLTLGNEPEPVLRRAAPERLPRHAGTGRVVAAPAARGRAGRRLHAAAARAVRRRLLPRRAPVHARARQPAGRRHRRALVGLQRHRAGVRARVGAEPPARRVPDRACRPRSPSTPGGRCGCRRSVRR
nr:hypothetical protein [Angustibacter aerolatus]